MNPATTSEELATEGLSPDPPVPVDAPEPRVAWSPATRIAFRLVVSYLIIEGAGFPIGYLPFQATRAIARWYLDAKIALGGWTQVHILGLASALPHAFTGSGDSMARVAMYVACVLLAIVVAVVWSVLDRHREHYRRLYAWVAAWERLALATIMFGYGFAKVLPTQFPTPSLERYVQPLGEFSPMGLLWTFMGHSPAYNYFTGGIELLGASLLLFRRTATLGALILIGTMSQVLMLNLAYDVPVKWFSMHLILVACFLAAPDAQRLARVLVLNRPTIPRRTPRLLSDARWRRVLTGAVAAFMMYIVWSDVRDGVETLQQIGPNALHPALYGIFDIAGLETNGVARPPLLTDSSRWRRIVFAQDGRVTLRTMSDSVTRFRSRTDTVLHSVRLISLPPATDTLTLAYERYAPDGMTLRGRVGGDMVVARLQRLDHTKFLLLNRPLQWVQERPFNR